MYYSVSERRRAMSKETLTFRTDSKKKEALDAIAESLDRDRSYVLNEAIDSYLEVHQWQMDQIKQAVKEAERGDFATEEEVNAVLKKYRPGK
jgi:predicted transcriptional regulator